MNDDSLRIEAKFKNARLFNAIMDATVATKPSYKGSRASVSSFCQAFGLKLDRVYALLNLSTKPLTRWKRLTKTAAQLCAALEKDPTWLFPADLYAFEWPRGLALETDAARFVPLLAAKERHLALPPSAEDDITRQELRQAIVGALGKLTVRQETVLKMRYGIDDDEHTLLEIGKQLGIGVARVQQLELTALRKLRHPSRSHALRPFIEVPKTTEIDTITTDVAATEEGTTE